MAFGAWRKAERMPFAKVGKSLPKFALIDERAFVRVQKLDRVFEGEDVNLLGFVQLIQQRGERSRLAAASRAGDEDDAVFLLHHLPKNRRQAERIERRNLRLQFAHHDRLPPVLPEDVNAETRDVRERVAAIAGAERGEVITQTRFAADQVICDHGDLRGR